MSFLTPSNEVSLLDIPHPVTYLNNHVQKAGLLWSKEAKPFDEKTGSGWFASIHVDGVEYVSDGRFKTKQEALDSAARAALITLGVKIPNRRG
ncbi:hypothetical protein FRB96_000795 [Tulasnella sp. 330]|nr:hypothetical protein FRB96_000795 [Tulasnella sp. 330]KAG8882516.1 hypothetical protein FRB97_008142 [Tulasnella sp. 331]KAG8888850.1 hypothetical protein FRB98_006636 [Tulasnella sp. 332]